MLLRIQVELQVIESFALKIAQGAAKISSFSAFVLQMAPYVPFEFILFETPHATVDPVLEYIVFHDVGRRYNTSRKKRTKSVKFSENDPSPNLFASRFRLGASTDKKNC